jgi:hypothetical protein
LKNDPNTVIVVEPTNKKLYFLQLDLINYTLKKIYGEYNLESQLLT